MGDLAKIHSFAKRLGSGTVLQLRWEGAGDCLHPAEILKKLKNMTYASSTTKIKFHAELNIYEAQTSAIAVKATQNMATAMAGATATQTYSFRYNADVTRTSRSIPGQAKAHMIFVRNIMLTDNKGHSLTDKPDELKDLHVQAIRNRSGSISDGGELKIGMSGQPGLSKDVLVPDRDSAPVKELFYGASELMQEATDKGLFVPVNTTRGSKDADVGEVMKNDGSSLGQKTTYYLTFTM